MSTIGARRARGIMLVEILLALVLTGLLAAGVASLMFATATGAKDQQELRRRNVRIDVLTHRIDAAIRSCGMLLARDERSMVFWVADVKRNIAPNLSELRRIEWDPATKQVLCYEAPSTLTDAADVTYDLATTDFLATTAALRGSTSFPATVWANNVSAWNASPPSTSPTTRLISYGVTIDLSTGGTHSARSSVSMRGTSARSEQ